MTAEEGLQKAIRLAGSQTKLAHIVGLKPQAVQRWQRVPLRWVVKISEELNIPKRELAPEFYTEKDINAIRLELLDTFLKQGLFLGNFVSVPKAENQDKQTIFG